MKYAFVRANREEFHVTRMCQVYRSAAVGITTGRMRKECERSRQDGVLLKKIRKIHLEMKEAYGATKAWRTLQAVRDGVREASSRPAQASSRDRSAA